MVGDVAAAPPTGNSAAHEPVAAFPSGDSAIHEVVAATAAPSPVPSGNSATREPIAVSPWGEPLFDGGFSLPMIHWNAPTSPLRDPTITTLDLFTDEIKRASSVTEASISSEKMLVPFRSLRGCASCISASVDLSTVSLRGTSCLTQAVICPGRSALLAALAHVAITRLIIRPGLANFAVSLVMTHSASMPIVLLAMTHTVYL